MLGENLKEDWEKVVNTTRKALIWKMNKPIWISHYLKVGLTQVIIRAC